MRVPSRFGGDPGSREKGQGMVEYGLMLGLISILVIGVFVIFGTEMVETGGVIDEAVGAEGVGEGQAALSAVTYG